jgi:ribonucleoside-diphosphate reductase alpha chain
MSNLCTEICLPQDKDNVAVCNLASLNLAAHVKNKEINWAKLEESVRLAIRQLDNLIDINKLPIPEAEKSDKENRAIGLGIMGFSDTIEQLVFHTNHEYAWDFADRIFEFISYMAIDESANLGSSRGSYMHFQGSGWSKGMVPLDSLKKLEEDRGRPLTVSKESKHKGLNWDILRAKVKKGMRNATLMAVAPNANIGLVAGTTPGIDPRFAQVFSRNKISGKYLDLNHNLVKDLKNMNIWEKVKEQIIENQGDISDIQGIPQHIKDIYKTSFTTSPFAFIEVAARAQKWVDQALSRNMYLETRDIDETMRIYQTAWDKGVKTTYYLHMKPRHTAEQSTVSVNKSQKMGRVGFAAIALKKAPADIAPQPFASPLQKTFDMPAPVKASSESTTAASTTMSQKIDASLGGLFEAPAPEVPKASMPVSQPAQAPVMPKSTQPTHNASAGKAGGFSSVASSAFTAPIAPVISTPIVETKQNPISNSGKGFSAVSTGHAHSTPAVAPSMQKANHVEGQPAANKPKGFVSLDSLKGNMSSSQSTSSANSEQSAKAKPKIYVNEDPADANICDSCQ